ncbi:MAG: hypothetical protein ACRDJ2_14750, partial [Actinomycetota bacterium]
FALYSTRDAERAGANYLNQLADQAPDETVARAVRACGRRAVADRRSLPAVAATGRVEGREVVVLGFARGQETGLLDRFLIVVYEIGRCRQPVERVGGRLPPP